MIKTNNHTGIMEMHNKKKTREAQPEIPCDSRQMTFEEMLHYDKMKPPDRTDKYKTTALQRPVMRTKPINNIWGDDDK